MRILFVVPYVPSLIRVRPYQLIRALAGRHEITLLAAASSREAADSALLHSICQWVEVVPWRPAASIGTCASALLRGEPLQAAVCQSPALHSRLATLLEARSFDLVHIEHLRAAPLSARLPANLPTIFDSVDCISLLLQRTITASHSWRQRLIARCELRRTQHYEARLLRRFDRIAVTAPEDARALCALGPAARVAVVPNGVDLDHFRPHPRPHDPATLVFSGKMSYHANVTAVLYFVRQILPLVRQAQPDVRLLIAGSNPPREILALTRDPAISVSGYLPDLRAALSRATVALCPVTVKVGIQNKLLEAMAMGLPVVSSREGVEGLAAQPGQDLLVGESPATFASHVCQLLADPDLRARLGLAGRRYVEAHHRWDGAAHRFELLYAEAIEQRAAASQPARALPAGQSIL